MPKVQRSTVKVRRKGRVVEIPRWVHEFNQRKKQERLSAKAGTKSPCQK